MDGGGNSVWRITRDSEKGATRTKTSGMLEWRAAALPAPPCHRPATACHIVYVHCLSRIFTGFFLRFRNVHYVGARSRSAP